MAIRRSVPPLMKVGDGEKLHYYSHHHAEIKHSDGRQTLGEVYTMCGREGDAPLVALPNPFHPVGDVCGTCRRADRAAAEQRAQEREF